MVSMGQLKVYLLHLVCLFHPVSDQRFQQNPLGKNAKEGGGASPPWIPNIAKICHHWVTEMSLEIHVDNSILRVQLHLYYHFLIIYYITFTHIHILLYNHIHIFSYIYTHPLTLTMGCCGEIWLLDKDGVAQRWEKEKLGIANFWKLPTFLFFQENMVSILGDSKHVLHAIAWSINVFPQGNAFSHIQEFSTGVSVVYVSLFLTPVENSVGAEAKFLDICLESPRNIFFLKIRTRGELQPTLVQRQLRQNLWQNLCTGQLLGWIGLSKRF